MNGAKFLLVVKPTAGLNIWDTPRPQSEGARKRRSVPVGTTLYATGVFNFSGVQYANLVPIDPTKPEWVRVAEAGSKVNEYCDVIVLESSDNSEMAISEAITRLAKAIEKLAAK